jgi:hypothetical protein
MTPEELGAELPGLLSLAHSIALGWDPIHSSLHGRRREKPTTERPEPRGWEKWLWNGLERRERERRRELIGQLASTSKTPSSRA